MLHPEVKLSDEEDSSDIGVYIAALNQRLALINNPAASAFATEAAAMAFADACLHASLARLLDPFLASHLSPLPP
jgi:hypothetical protein